MQRIFQLYDAGHGLRTIAKILERDGLPSPGEIGAVRHPRSAGVRGGSAVRAILLNPRYLGRQIAGRLRRSDELLDPTDAALGATSRQRWQKREAWSWSEEPAWPPLVDAELWQRVNQRLVNNPGTRERKPRSEPGRYVLSGLVRCGHCGKSINGTTAKGKPYYRCAATRPDYAEPAVAGHPPTYMVREERIAAALDTWLCLLTGPEQMDATVAEFLAADGDSATKPPEISAARHRQHKLNTKLDRMLAAIRAGMDPELAAGETRKIQAELAAVAATINEWETSRDYAVPLTEEDVRHALGGAGSLVELLADADRTDRAELHRAPGVQLHYEKEAPTGLEPVHARLELGRSGGLISALATTASVYLSVL